MLKKHSHGPVAKFQVLWVNDNSLSRITNLDYNPTIKSLYAHNNCIGTLKVCRCILACYLASSAPALALNPPQLTVDGENIHQIHLGFDIQCLAYTLSQYCKFYPAPSPSPSPGPRNPFTYLATVSKGVPAGIHVLAHTYAGKQPHRQPPGNESHAL